MTNKIHELLQEISKSYNETRIAGWKMGLL